MTFTPRAPEENGRGGLENIYNVTRKWLITCTVIILLPHGHQKRQILGYPVTSQRLSIFITFILLFIVVIIGGECSQEANEPHNWLTAAVIVSSGDGCVMWIMQWDTGLTDRNH